MLTVLDKSTNNLYSSQRQTDTQIKSFLMAVKEEEEFHQTVSRNGSDTDNSPLMRRKTSVQAEMLRKSSVGANPKAEEEAVPQFGMARKMSDEWLHEKNTDDQAEESPACQIVI